MKYRFVCPECRAMFSHESGLELHTRLYHPGGKAKISGTVDEYDPATGAPIEKKSAGRARK
jgi:hypothetical protein